MKGADFFQNSTASKTFRPHSNKTQYRNVLFKNT